MFVTSNQAGPIVDDTIQNASKIASRTISAMLKNLQKLYVSTTKEMTGSRVLLTAMSHTKVSVGL